MISEVRIVTMSVTDLQRALNFYGEVIGYTVLAEGAVPDSLREAWRVPEGVEGAMALLAADDSGTGMLRIIQYSGDRDSIWNEDNQLFGNGFDLINFRGRDIKQLLPEMIAAGATGDSEPTFWDVSDDVSVLDSITKDPDGIRLDIFTYTKGGELRGPLNTRVSPVQTIAVCTHDIEKCRAFYGGLGFEVLFDKKIEHLGDFLGHPPGVYLHNVNMIKDGTIIPGRVEMFKYVGIDDDKRINLTEKAVPPNIGLLSASFETTDLSAAMDLFRMRGASKIAEPVDVDMPGLGMIQLATFTGPDGECLEIYQKT